MKSTRISITIPTIVANKLDELVQTGLFGLSRAGAARELLLRGIRDYHDFPRVHAEALARITGRKR